MANYSYIGYAPNSIVFGGGSTVSLSGTYDPDDRRVFNVADDDVGTVLNGGAGRPDEGTIFDGDRYNNEGGDDATQTGDATNLDGTTTYESGNIYLEQSYTLTAAGEDDIILYRIEIGPVPFLCRSKCSFRPLSVRRRLGFSSPMLSAADADCRSR